ncbi:MULTISPECIES: sirohydrochlorin chelatase [unclassified Oceanobacillus]|uniref:sirohydrochlorin chelatase n=1 Tax=unclassified Oceanobacillus TaxID=2630292 RepID=UPI001BEA4CAE|nr:sirohydrochlorin chelatase [Oceanobacillus sp. ISL-74]MBT2651509.1 sirohydrochlorin chelatase [Oceanobacillus sp. ISL-73]
MQGVLYVSHGSRIPEATAGAIAFINEVKKQIDIPLQEICFLEISKPDVGQGVDNLIKQGATKIAIVPVLLLRAGHYYQDIPEEIKQLKNKYPLIQFIYGEPLGVQNRLTNVLVERIEDTNIQPDEGSKILLVGRGSRSPQTQKDIEQIASNLQLKMNLHVDVCYLAACSPSFEHGLRSSLEENYSRVFVVPYLWFTGVLLQSMEREINVMEKQGKDFILCSELSKHPIMVEALKDRVQEAIHSNKIYNSTREVR